MSPTEGKSRVVPGRYPPPGIDPNADAIRERRGARGITALDANLLHVPVIAGGYSSLLGAVRTKGHLPGDLREAMVSPLIVQLPSFYSDQHLDPESSGIESCYL